MVIRSEGRLSAVPTPRNPRRSPSIGAPQGTLCRLPCRVFFGALPTSDTLCVHLFMPGPCRRLGKPSGESRGGQRGPTNPQTECQDHQAPWGTLSALHSAARAQRHKPLATTVTARRAPGRWHAYADRCGCLGPPRPQRRDSGTFHPRFSGT
ncbi:unnamed protein product [Rangifer tarandus platyrhynchus]|uniref:Uncharacterized protein n=1 Tax=Rangifer tarandus platyrhynchus TaxID=3082113 RepID=A0AC60A446_RANTA